MVDRAHLKGRKSVDVIPLLLSATHHAWPVATLDHTEYTPTAGFNLSGLFDYLTSY